MPILMHGGGGSSLSPLSSPASASDILIGQQAYTDQSVKMVGTLDVPDLNSLSVTFSNQSTSVRNISMTCVAEGEYQITVPPGDLYDVFEVDLAQPITVAEQTGVSLQYEDFTLFVTLT